MESTLPKPALVAATRSPEARAIVYWIATTLFCLQMSFTAYAELRLPQVAEAFVPRLPRLLPGGTLVGQAPRGGADSRAGAAAAQGMGLGRLRHRPRLGAHRAPLGGRWPRGLGLGSGYRCALGDFVLPLASPATQLT